MLVFLAYFMCAVAATVALVPVCRAAALRAGYVAQPNNDRWHRRPTALLGGVAIALTVNLGALLLPITPRLAVLLVCGTLAFFLGLVDDMLGLKPSTKLVGEIVIASILLFFGFRLEWTSSLLLDSVLTMVWIVGITNAFNLLDNMDGLCAGTSIIAGVSLLIGTLSSSGPTGTTAYLALLLGATAGFLLYNFHPASIFMGDSGSLYLGLNLAALTLEATDGGRPGPALLSVVAMPVMVLLIPIFDTGLVTISRLLARRSPAQGGRDHSSHRLVAVGLSERTAVTVLWSLAAIGGAISVAVRSLDVGLSTVLAVLFSLAMIIFAVYLSRIRIYVDATLAPAEGKLTPLVTNFMYKRRVAEVLLDMLLIPSAYYLAYRLRFEGSDFVVNYPYFLQSLPMIIGVQIVAVFAVGGYRGIWRQFSLMDAVVFGKGVVVGVVGTELLVLYVYRFQSFSRTVFIIYGALLYLLLVASRGSFRLVSEFVRRRQTVGRRCVIYGAGEGGALVLRELQNATGEYRVLGFVDDDPTKASVRVRGYPVLGGYEMLLALVGSGAVDVVVISTVWIDGDRRHELARLCAEHGTTLTQLRVGFDKVAVT
jgi:UDP-GlcNAc:undecaprenyl-phosphate GlcNAc-1-phosphate transferase